MATWGWGLNGASGTLGVGDTAANHTTPAAVTGGVDFISAAPAASASAAVFLARDRTVYTTGSNTFGTWGNGTTGGSPRLTPVQVSGLTNIRKVDAGGLDCYAMDSSGNLWGWGLNSEGQYGQGNTTQHTSPFLIRTDVTDFGAGNEHLIVLTNTGVVLTAGFNSAGQLVTGDTTSHTSWQTVTPASGTVVQVAGGDLNSMVRFSDGSVSAAGSNNGSALAISPAGGNRTAWTAMPFTTSVDIKWGSSAAFSLRNDATLWSVGNNTQGQLGMGSTSPATSATQVQVVLPGGVTVAAFSIFWNAAAGSFLGSNALVYTWGGGSTGQMGNGTTTVSNPTPISGNGLTGQVWLIAGGVYMWSGDQTAIVTSHPRGFATVIG